MKAALLSLLLFGFVLLISAQSPRDKAIALANRLNVTQKIALVHGYGGGYVGNVNAIPAFNIPALHLQDGPQGVGDGVTKVTCWPASITVAATWDRDLMFQWGVALGLEQHGKGTNVHLGPDINLARVPKGGRVFEMFGEDPYLTAELATSYVRGVQGQGVIATAKHYINNDQENNRDYVSVTVDLRTNWELYYQPFVSAVQAGVGAVMCSYNRINNTYACENKQTLSDLKNGMGFQGWVMSDWGATHSTVNSAVNGLDQEMPGANYFGNSLQTAINNGQVPQQNLDDKVVRIFTAMYEARIFDTPQNGNLQADVQSAQHVSLARNLSAQGTVLLKNQGILPLTTAKPFKLAVIGDDGDASAYVAGDGSGHVIPPYVITPLQGIKSRAGSNITISYSNSQVNNAVNLAKGSDIAIVFAYTKSSEGSDRPNLQLANNQSGLIEAVVAAQPNTIVVLHVPGAVLMPWAKDVKAILVAFYPGQEDGNAIAEVLFGDVNPGGKLPLTFPVAENDWYSGDNSQYPGVGSIEQYTEKLLIGYRWYDAKNIQPLFPFGHGLSYTTFDYSTLKITGTVASGINVNVDIQNSGSRAGSEVVQLYLAFPTAAGEPPQILRGFQKLYLRPGQSGTAMFTLKSRDVSIWDVASSNWKVVTGSFGINVGSSSRDIRLRGTFNV